MWERPVALPASLGHYSLMNTDATAQDPAAQFAAAVDSLSTLGHNIMVAAMCAAIIGFAVLAMGAVSRARR